MGTGESLTGCRPSQVTRAYWLIAQRREGEYPRSTKRSGKWLIFVNADRVDKVWTSIKVATEEGKLGEGAKVATARGNPNASDPDKRVICVYTYEWKDMADVMRIRNELRKLGIIRKIPYKADEDTFKGKYRVSGHTKISKYYE